jgi:hypothetical protein
VENALAFAVQTPFLWSGLAIFESSKLASLTTFGKNGQDRVVNLQGHSFFDVQPRL